MNTLDDLRATLEREAAFDDTERHLRPVAVRQRVRAVRRRRAGAVAMAAVAALVVTTATAGVLRGGTDPEPAGPSLDDVRVPQRVDVLGFPYELTTTQRAGVDGTVTVADAPDGLAAVTLVATGLGSGEATLWSGYYAMARVRGNEHLSVPVDGVALSQLRIEFDGTPDSARAEVAIYEPTGGLAPGVTSAGAVFRQQYAGHELVDAAFGEAGGEVRLVAPDSLDDLDTSAYCHSTTPGLWLHQEGASGGTPCADLASDHDPGPANEGALFPPRRGDDSIAVYVTRGEGGPRATGLDVTFGLALYRQTAAPTRLFGADVPTVLEEYGRSWRLAETVPWTGEDDIEVDTSHSDALVAAAYVGATSGYLSWAGAPEGGWTRFGGAGEASSSPSVMYGPLLLAGDHMVQLHLEGPDPQGRLLVYRPE